jgi:hypothetical protein
MKILKYLSLILIAGMMFSCEKDMEKQVVKQDVVFGVNDIIPTLKSDLTNWDWECSEAEPVSALLEVDGVWYNPYLFTLGGKLYTQAIKLDVKDTDYILTNFMLLDDKLTTDEINDYETDGLPSHISILKAAPHFDSEYWNYVNKQLDISFKVVEFDKKEVQVDVLCYHPSLHEQFGFIWFNVNEFVVKEICFFGDLCIKDYTDYIGTKYDNVFDLQNYPFDLPAIFEIKAFKKDENGIYEPYADFTNYIPVDNGYEFTGPVCAKFPDPVDPLAKEYIKFQLWVNVKVGNTDDYVLFDEWEFNSKNPPVTISATDQEVIDFVIGNCYNPSTPPRFIYPPYHNLPKTANLDISINTSNPFEYGAYWKMKVNSLSPLNGNFYDFPAPSDTTTYLGWCGDATTTINQGSNISFNIYSSLNDNNWPSGMPVTKGDLAKVNWLFNNLPDDYPTLDEMFVTTANFTPITVEQGKNLQHAIWKIFGQTPPNNTVGSAGFGNNTAAQDMANLTIGKEGFVPLPGGYAAVLMVKNDNPIEFQLVFTIVDP